MIDLRKTQYAYDEYAYELAKDDGVRAILSNGYVYNNRMHRRWIMAQMMRLIKNAELKIEATGKQGAEALYNAMRVQVASQPYKYILRAMAVELNTWEHLKKRDPESYEERLMFYDEITYWQQLNAVVLGIESACEIRLNKSRNDVQQGRNDIDVEGLEGNILRFIKDLHNTMKEGKMCAELVKRVAKLCNAGCHGSYVDSNRPEGRLFSGCHVVTAGTPQWAELYLQEGAYYTWKNLITFHGKCYYHGDNVSEALMNLKRVANEQKYKSPSLCLELITCYLNGEFDDAFNPSNWESDNDYELRDVRVQANPDSYFEKLKEKYGTGGGEVNTSDNLMAGFPGNDNGVTTGLFSEVETAKKAGADGYGALPKYQEWKNSTSWPTKGDELAQTKAELRSVKAELESTKARLEEKEMLLTLDQLRTPTLEEIATALKTIDSSELMELASKVLAEAKRRQLK